MKTKLSGKVKFFVIPILLIVIGFGAMLILPSKKPKPIEIKKKEKSELQTSPKKSSHPPGHPCNPYPLSKASQDTNRKWPGYRGIHETKIPQKEIKKDQKKEDDDNGIWYIPGVGFF